MASAFQSGAFQLLAFQIEGGTPEPEAPRPRGDSARAGKAFREASRRAVQTLLEEEARRALKRFPGKRSKPTITREMLQAAAEVVLNAPDLPDWEFKSVGRVIADILGAPFGRQETRAEITHRLLELAQNKVIDEDDDELIEAAMISRLFN